MNENSQLHKILEKLNQIKTAKYPDIQGQVEKLNEEISEINRHQSSMLENFIPTLAVLKSNMKIVKETCEKIDVKLEQKANRRTVNTFAVIIVSLFTAWLSALTVLRFIP